MIALNLLVNLFQSDCETCKFQVLCYKDGLE
jgi:hypothetical protein